MKKYNNVMVLLVLFLCAIPIKGMEVQVKDPQGPMDSTWFYDFSCVAYTGNQFYQQQKWASAVAAYEKFLDQRKTLLSKMSELRLGDLNDATIPKNVYVPLNTGMLGTEYDVNKVKLNLALCKMALGQSSPHWASFDELLNIAKDRLLRVRSFESIVKERKDSSESDILDILGENPQCGTVEVYGLGQHSVLVRTDLIGIGDIFHFLSAVEFLQLITRYDVVVSVPQFLKDTLACAAEAYGFTLIGTKDVVPKTDYETHLISLLGYLGLAPMQLNPEKVVFTAPERARNAVLEQIVGPLNLNYIVAAVFAGENRQAKLIGGKKLPNDTTSHGRHLNSEGFEALLGEHPGLILIDCGTQASRITIKEELYKNRCLVIAGEKQAFDTIIALASIMNEQKRVIGIGADNGPTNVFVRSLDKKAQNRMALIIPNPQEYDVRMENWLTNSDKYGQMISNAWVYKCKSPAIEHQIKTIERAYTDMIQHK